MSYCSTYFILGIYLWIWSSRLLNSTFVVLVLFWGYIYESEAADSWIPHLAYVLLNKTMVKVEALVHSYGGTATQVFHFCLYDCENCMYVFQFHLLLSSIGENNACKNSSTQSKSLTLWKKCLIFCCSGFTVFSSNRNLEFRVDSYPWDTNDEVFSWNLNGPSHKVYKKYLLSFNWTLQSIQEYLLSFNSFFTQPL